jgi:hypothetical protein
MQVVVVLLVAAAVFCIFNRRAHLNRAPPLIIAERQRALEEAVRTDIANGKPVDDSALLQEPRGVTVTMV